MQARKRTSSWAWVVLPLCLVAPATGAGQQVKGTVTDPTVQQPVPDALVVMVNEQGDRVATVFTTEAGEFTLDVPQLGAYRVGVARIGYQQAITPQFQVAEADVALDIFLPADPVALDSISVVSTRNTPDAGRLRGFLPGERSRGTLVGRMTRVELAALGPSRDLVTVIQSMNMPGVSARYMPLADGGPSNGLCIESGRHRSVLAKTGTSIASPAVRSIGARPLDDPTGADCQMMAVYVDNVFVPDPADVLASLAPDDVESLEVLSSLESLARFGARAANGALLIWTTR